MNNTIDESSSITASNLGEHLKIYSNCHIINSSIDDHSIIGESSLISGSTICKNVQLNRRSMVRDSIIGDYSYGGMNLTVFNSVIQKFSSISWDVTIGGGQHDYNRLTTHAFLYNPSFGMLPSNVPIYDRFIDKCEIGNDVWIGSGVQVLRGVTIGDGAIVGAGSVVTKDVMPYSIVAGNPAHVIKMRFKDSVVIRLLEIKWWNLPPKIIKDNIDLFSAVPNEKTLSALEKLTHEK